jgi:hypothetical protein
MRHYYDLYNLLQQQEVQDFIGTEPYRAHKAKRFRRGDEPDLTKNEAFNLRDAATRVLYTGAFKQSTALYYGAKPTFEEILKTLSEWTERL